ncbi:uncharacterized protein LOC132202782 [Neocloeon triangulifer]|uniref:uncharacterized protein LOC132202782 n=1 Tax=Neocloeon triangulifer TaxID=2078957 RepID=UPI00286F492A|nr:uncharacterized protein LOC132202782 [Neocloeon triangulifer]
MAEQPLREDVPLSVLDAGHTRRLSGARSSSQTRPLSQLSNGAEVTAFGEKSASAAADPTKTPLLMPVGSSTPIVTPKRAQPARPFNGRNLYRDPTRRHSSPRRQISQVSRTLSVEPKSKSCCSVSRCFVELLWFLMGLRHFIAEVPLLVLLVISPSALGALFYMGLVFTCLPGLVATISNIRSGRKSKKKTKCSFLVMQSFFLLFRLESFLRLFELACPSLRTKGRPWPAKVAMAQVVSGSAVQLILNAADLGWCANSGLVPPTTLPPNIVQFRGMERLYPNEINPLKHCGPLLSGFQTGVLFVSAMHIGWAIAVTSMPPPFPTDKRAAAITASIWSLLRSTSLVAGTIGNFLIAGSRSTLVFMAVGAGAPPWIVPVVMGAWLAIRLTVQLGMHAWGSAPMPNLAEALLSTVAVPVAATPRQLGRRCLLMGIQNVVVLTTVVLKARNKPDMLFTTYRLAVLQVVAFFTGIIFLLVRIRWVDPSKPLAEGKCFHHRTDLHDDA